MYERIYCIERVDELVKLDKDMRLIYVCMADFVEDYIVNPFQSIKPGYMLPTDLERMVYKNPHIYLLRTENV